MGTESKRRKGIALNLDVVEEVLREVENIANEKERNKERLAIEAEILDNLAVLGGKTFHDDDIVFAGDKLTVPTNMTLTQARVFLEKKEEEQEKETVFARTFSYRPWDGAWCTWNVLKKIFGAVGHRGHLNMFGKEMPPQMIEIPSGVGTKETVPWGRFELPFLPGAIFTMDQAEHPEKGVLFSIMVEAPKKYRFEVEGIFRLIEEELATNSLYRGKAFDGQQMPEFIDVFSVDRSRVVYSEEVLTQLDANVWAQLRYTKEFEAQGIPLKRAVMIHGPFGTGKTLACLLTGQEAVKAGWTFIKARPGRDDIGEVLQTARLYEPSVVFYEDIDQIASAEDTDRESMSQLLDDFDGIEAKGTKILCVFTTNYPEKIHKGMARPGRLDAMIEINELDQQGVEKLVKSRIEDLLNPDIDWVAVFEAAHDYKPAFVTEFADRTVRYVIAKHGSAQDHLISTEDLVNAAQGLRPQYEKMMGANDQPVIDKVGEAIKRDVTTVVNEVMADRGF